MSNSWIDSGDGTGIFCEADADNNVLQLKLKKPKAWKWELTTSRSSPNIALPRIMLFNHKGNLLVDANQQVDDAVYKMPTKPSRRRGKRILRAATTNLERSLQDDEDTGLGSLDSTEKHTYKPQRKDNISCDSLRLREKPLKYRKTSVDQGEKKQNGCKSWRLSVPDEIDIGSLQICEATDSDRVSQRSPSVEDLNIYTPWRRKSSPKEKIIEPQKTNKEIFLNNSPERQFVSKTSCKPFNSIGHLDAESPLPEPFERRASSFKEVRFKVHPASDDEESKPREKRRYRRSNTSRSTLSSSGSILERFSAMKCRLSSPEFETGEIHQIQMGPRYFLRTSRAGTIVVAEENFNMQRRARRKPPKTSSAENFLSPSSSLVKNNNSYKEASILGASLGAPCSQSQSMNNFGELKGNRQRRKIIPIRRHKSDGNIILPTSSDEEDQRSRTVRHRKGGFWRRNQEDAKNQTNLGG